VKRLTWAVVAALAATMALGQQGYFETFEVRLHDLEVVVTDSKGAPVRGLGKDDFIVLENGAPQAITNFSVYDSATATVSSGTAEITQTPEQTPEPSSPPRRIVFFVDDMGVRKPARTTLIRNATALVDQFQPGDLISVVRPTGPNRLALPFTTDTAAARKAVTEAIESCKYNLRSSGDWDLEDMVNGLENARSDIDRAYARGQYAKGVGSRTEQRLGQLRALIGSMAGVEGRKVIVLITSGLPSNPGRSAGLDPMKFGPANSTVVGNATRDAMDQPLQDWEHTGGDLNPLIDELGRTAAANGVTIYALEPEVPLGVAARQITAGSSTTGSTATGLDVRGQAIVPVDMYGEMSHYRTETLRSLSERTGGRWFRGVATIDDVFRQVASDLSTYYSLAYRATGEHDKPRRVEVRVRNRPDLNVRTRTEVVDRSPEREMGDLVAATLLFPRDVNELHMTLHTGDPKSSSKGKAVTIPIEVEIPLRTLTFLPIQDGKYAANVDIHYAIAGIKSSFMTSGRQRQYIEISAEQFNTRARANYRYKTGVEVWRGPTRIAVGVLDPASKLAGFRTADVVAE
jgi:VWFA-related protein